LRSDGDAVGSAGPKGVDFTEFAPNAGAASGVDGVGVSTFGSGTHRAELEHIEKIEGGHLQVAGILHARLTTMQAVRRLWCRADHQGAMDAMQKAGEAAVLVDFLEATVERPELITLEMAAGVLPQLAPLLESRHRCAAASA
jgi:hypothetical protein